MDGQYSLAHELAAALMPEPSAGSKLLAEEFGIEFDEGAEGIEEQAESNPSGSPIDQRMSFADELGGTSHNELNGHDLDESHLHASGSSRGRDMSESDAMETLLSNMESTDHFLSHLRELDAPQSSGSAAHTVEVLASSIIRRLNEASREREGQVRALLGYEREFRKIASEVGGGDALAQVEPWEDAEDEIRNESGSKALETLEEEPEPPLHDSHSSTWDNQPESRTNSVPVSPTNRRFSMTAPPPPPADPSLPSTSSYISQTVPHFAYARLLTTSVLTSVTSISELCQINGAGTADAGRKIRALKTKIVEWRADTDLADQSMKRIEKWESRPTENSSSQSSYRRRVDGRKVVQEHLVAFEGALSDATNKTLAILAGA